MNKGQVSTSEKWHVASSEGTRKLTQKDGVNEYGTQTATKREKA